MAERKYSLKKRIKVMAGLFLFGVMVLIIRLAWVQFVDGNKYKMLAAEQQTRDSQITARRGTIYDCNMKVLAQSATAEKITINPAEIKKAKNAKKVTDALVKILGVKRADVEKKIALTERQSELIASRVEKSTADVLRAKGLRGVYFEEDSKRYYPYGSLASHVIGFTGTDNQGLEGIENVLDEELKGQNGRVVVVKDVRNTEMPFKYESYIEAKDGTGVVLTIDETIQQYTEKHLQEAYETNLAGAGGAAIVMNPKTGEILSMAVVPTYDLNKPHTINDQLLLEQLEEKMDELEAKEAATLENSSEEKKKKTAEERRKEAEAAEKKRKEEYQKAYSDAVIKMRRNKAVVDSYEPGSTFKTIVAASALEEGASTLNDSFVCNGVRHVANRDIHCWNRDGHGVQTFTQGVMNSCNPMFMELGSRLGADTFRKYFNAFGLTEVTNFTIPGESSGNFHETLGVVDLATSSFGQTFTVTPLQMISAISAVVNGGKLMKPYIVKAYTDKDGKITKKFEPEMVRSVISEETSTAMRGVLEKVVSDGTGSGAFINGFSIGGKTGTSEKLPRGSGKYIASFVGFAPADDPQVVCLLLIDEPNAGVTGGGAIAAPAVGKIIQDVLPYMGYGAKYSEEEQAEIAVTVPLIEGLSREKALEKIENAGLKISIKGSGDEITNQIPKADSKLHKGSVVIAYTGKISEEEKVDESTIVPDVNGLTYEEAKKKIEDASLVLKLESNNNDEITADYIAVSQSPEAKTSVAENTAIYVKFVRKENN